jgi:hypothetical protein
LIIKQNPKNDEGIKIINLKEPQIQNLNFEGWHNIPYKNINASNDFIIEYRIFGKTGELIEKIRNQNAKLSDIARASLGCQAYNSSKHSKEDIQNRIYHSDFKIDNDYLPELTGSDVERYFYKQKKGQWIKYGPWLHDYRTIDWLQGPSVSLSRISI